MNNRIKLPALAKVDDVNELVVNTLVTKKSKRTKTLQDVSSYLGGFPEDIAKRIANNDEILELFPDIEEAMNIRIGFIIAPTKMVTPELRYRLTKLKLPIRLKEKLLELTENTIESVLSLNSKLANIVKEVKYTKGAYPILILNDTTVNNFVNEYSKTANNRATLTTESSNIVDDLGLGLELTYNLSSIKTNLTTEAAKPTVQENEVDVIINKFKLLLEGEDIPKVDGIEFNNKTIPVGHPVITYLPVESVAPIINKNDPTNPLGYLISLDKDGNPIRVENLDDINTNMHSAIKSGYENPIIAKAAEALYGVNNKPKENDLTPESLTELLNDRIANSINKLIHKEDIKIENTNGIFNIMLYRVLKSLSTKMVIVPPECIAYNAINYRTNGTGKSELEKLIPLASLRAMLLYSRVKGTVKNNISTTAFNITLDPKDPNPEKTMQKLRAEILKSESNTIVNGLLTPAALSEWTKMQGLSFNFKHPELPDITIDKSVTTGEKNVSDTSLDDDIKKQTRMRMGIPPDIVEQGFNGTDFATGILFNNALLLRKIINDQLEFNNMFTNMVKKVLAADGKYIYTVKDMIKTHYRQVVKYIDNNTDNLESIILEKVPEGQGIKLVLNLILDNILAELPEPETSGLGDNRKAYNDYVEAVDEFLNNYLGSDILNSTIAGDIADNVDDLKNIIKHTLIRKYAADNGYLTDVLDTLATVDKDYANIDAGGEFNSFLTDIYNTFKTFSNKNAKIKEKINKLLEKFNNGDTGEETGSTGDTGGNKDIGGKEDNIGSPTEANADDNTVPTGGGNSLSENDFNLN